MTQTRTLSFIEAKTNAVLGLVISWLFTYYGLPYIIGTEPTTQEASIITLSYFLLSLGRGYFVRRFFERIK